VSGLTVRLVPGGVRFGVRVQPRASRSEIRGVHGDVLRVRVAAPPVDGAANEALIALLADELGVARGAIRIASGGSSRTKVVEVAGIDRAAADRLASRSVSG
jgi:uncharacterized protein (TIGR00251 family)